MSKDDILISLGKASEILGVHKATFRSWGDRGIVEAVRTPGGHRRYRASDMDALLRRESDTTPDQTRAVIYGRVSSHDQKKKGDLERQVGRVSAQCAEKGYIVTKILQEVGSGMSDTRPKLKRLFRMVNDHLVDVVVVEHKDRLCRFGEGGRSNMLITRAYKVELDPNNKQRSALVQHCGAARHVYNWGLAEKQKAYKETGKSLGAMELHRKLNEMKKVPQDQGGKPWLYFTSKCAGQEALRDLDRAFQNFFRRCKQGTKRKGYPRFKSRKNGIGSCRFTGTIRSLDTHVQLPNLGKIRLKERGYLPTPENKNVRILSATVSEKAGRWFVSFAVKEEISDPKPNAKAKSVGVDVGINFLATCSDGVVYENPRALKRSLGRLKRLQRSMSRKKKGSRNRQKAVERVRRLHYRIACLRADTLHKATTDIVKAYAVIGIETLNVSGMLQNRCLSRAISEASMSEFLRQLRYKAEWRGAEVVEAPRFYPSSKTCSRCGNIKKDLTLSDRVYRCASCGLVIGRDLNAAINLKNMAASSAVSACGEISSGFGLRNGVKLASVKQEPNRRSACLGM